MSQNIDPFPFTNSNWRGMVLVWDEQAIFLGLAGAASLHESPAIKICISLEGSFGLQTQEDDTFTNYESAIIAPGQAHAIDGRHNKMAMLLLVPEAKLAQSLVSIYSANGITRLSSNVVVKVRRVLEALIQRLDSGDADESVEIYCSQIVNNLTDNKNAPIDSRVTQGIEWIRARRDDDITVEDIARSVELSESRFSHIFTDNVRISVRRYLLWLRLRDAMTLLSQGKSLTETAHEAGFSDSAHLTRTFRGMLGIAPSALTKESLLISFLD